MQYHISMKKYILSSIVLLAGLTMAQAQTLTEVQPADSVVVEVADSVVVELADTVLTNAAKSFFKDTYIQVGDGLAVDLAVGLGNAVEVSVGKWFNKSVGASVNYTNVYIFDGQRSFSDNLIGAAFLWNFLGLMERNSIWTPVLSPELGFMFTSQQGADNSAYAAGSFFNYFRVHPHIDVMANVKGYFGIDPHNSGRIRYITMPTGIVSVGARYRF